jgi:foldase protein PrsA
LKRSIWFICAAAVFVTGCSKGEQLAAVVNKDPITMEEFHRYLELKPQVTVIVNPAQLQSSGAGQLPQQPYKGSVAGSVALQGMTDLVQQTLLQQLAKDEGVYPTKDEVDQELADRTKASPSYVRELTAKGFTLPMIRKDITMELCQFKITTKGIVVTDDEVNKYIQEHPKEFVVPEQVELLWMLVSDDKMRKAADNDLKQGQSFLKVAAKYSQAPNAATMGYHFPESRVPALASFGPDLMPAVQKLQEQGQTDWIKFTEGWARFYVSKKTPEKKVAIDDAMRKRVKRALMVQKGAPGKDLDARLQEKLRTADVKIMIDYLQDPWKSQMESLQNSAATK